MQFVTSQEETFSSHYDEKSNHWRWIPEWFKRQNGAGDTFLWQQWIQNQVFQIDFHWRRSSKTTWGRMTSSLLLGPLIWVIISIHSYLPRYMADVSILLLLLGSFNCSRKVTRSSLETIRPVHQRKEYLCCQRFISVQSNMYSVETRMHWRMLTQPGKWFPQILYPNHLYNTHTHITSDPEILVKYYKGKVSV